MSGLRSVSMVSIVIVLILNFAASVFAQSDEVKVEEEKETDRKRWGLDTDLRLRYKASFWRPQAIKGADVKTTGMNIGEGELKFRLSTPWFFLPIPKTLKYEYAFGGDNALQNDIIELQSKHRTSYTRILVDLPLFNLWAEPFDNLLNKIGVEKPGSLDYQYDTYAFSSKIKLKNDKRYVPLSGDSVDLVAGDAIRATTLFEKHSLFYRKTKNKDDGIGIDKDWFVGLFYIEYSKPYAVTIFDVQYAETIREGRFSAWGLTVGWSEPIITFEQIDLLGISTIEQLDWDYGVTMDLGRGDIDFANGQNIDEYISRSRSVAYGGFGFNSELSCRLSKSCSLEFAGSIWYHGFIQWPPVETERLFKNNRTRYKLNDDLVWSVMANFTWSF